MKNIFKDSFAAIIQYFIFSALFAITYGAGIGGKLVLVNIIPLFLLLGAGSVIFGFFLTKENIKQFENLRPLILKGIKGKKIEIIIKNGMGLSTIKIKEDGGETITAARLCDIKTKSYIKGFILKSGGEKTIKESIDIGIYFWFVLPMAVIILIGSQYLAVKTPIKEIMLPEKVQQGTIVDKGSFQVTIPEGFKKSEEEASIFVRGNEKIRIKSESYKGFDSVAYYSRKGEYDERGITPPVVPLVLDTEFGLISQIMRVSFLSGISEVEIFKKDDCRGIILSIRKDLKIIYLMDKGNTEEGEIVLEGFDKSSGDIAGIAGSIKFKK